MNWLAHAFLSGGHPELLVGNVMGDFVKGRLERVPHLRIRAGLWLHRRIDTWTDSHPAWRRSVARVRSTGGRAAGILVDIGYDHLLARGWERYSAEPLEQFTARVYALLHEHHGCLPERLARILPRMAAEDWLAGYRSLEGVERTLERMSARAPALAPLREGGSAIRAAYPALERDFREFFPELQAVAARLAPAALHWAETVQGGGGGRGEDREGAGAPCKGASGEAVAGREREHP